MIVKFNDEKKTAQVSLRAEEILNKLQEGERNDPNNVKSLWRPEYAGEFHSYHSSVHVIMLNFPAYMVEGTPGKPYGALLAHFNIVESSMKYRREEIKQLLMKDEVVMSLTNFPRLGSPQFSYPTFDVRPNDPESAAQSLYFPDEAIFDGHPRFKTLTRNIRQRRGEKVSINVPVYKDEKTKIPVDGAIPSLPDHIHMDAMGFGSKLLKIYDL